MSTVRILLGSLSLEWKRRIIEAVNSEPELEIIGDVADPFDLLVEARENKMDIVVLAQLPGGSEPGICSHLLLELPSLVMVLLPAEFDPHVPFRIVVQKEATDGNAAQQMQSMLRWATSFKNWRA